MFFSRHTENIIIISVKIYYWFQSPLKIETFHSRFKVAILILLIIYSIILDKRVN